MTHGSAVSRVAAMIGRTAFFAAADHHLAAQGRSAFDDQDFP